MVEYDLRRTALVRSFIKALPGIILVAPLLFPGIASAEAIPGAPAPGSSFDQRLEQRKKERNPQLDDKTQKRIVEKCASAQTNIRTVQQRLPQIFDDKTKLHQKIDGKLWVTIGQLKLAQKDTFELEKARATLAGMSAENEATSTYFQQTIDDILIINCKADVVGFKSLLDTARIYLSLEREQTIDIRTYIVDQVKPVLAAHITDLQPKPPTKGGQ